MDNLLYNALEKYRRGIHHVFPLFVIHSAHMVGMTWSYLFCAAYILVHHIRSTSGQFLSGPIGAPYFAAICVSLRACKILSAAVTVRLSRSRLLGIIRKTRTTYATEWMLVKYAEPVRPSCVTRQNGMHCGKSYLDVYQTWPLALMRTRRLATVTSWYEASFSLRKNVSGSHKFSHLSPSNFIWSIFSVISLGNLYSSLGSFHVWRRYKFSA